MKKQRKISKERGTVLKYKANSLFTFSVGVTSAASKVLLKNRDHRIPYNFGRGAGGESPRRTSLFKNRILEKNIVERGGGKCRGKWKVFYCKRGYWFASDED